MYFKIEQDENKNYEIRMTDKFYSFTYPFYKKDSYFNIFYRLFNLLPKDFYHYIGTTYHAQFQNYHSLLPSLFPSKAYRRCQCRHPCKWW